jgi:hypothetical protein
MANPPTVTETDYFDCSSLSISFARNGLASISFTVFRPKDAGPPYTTGGPGFEIDAGGTHFKGYVMGQDLIPASDILMNEWRVTAVAIGCKQGVNLSTQC